MKCMFLKKQYRSCTCMLKYQTWTCTLYIIDIRQTGILKESIGIYFFSDTKKKRNSIHIKVDFDLWLRNFIIISLTSLKIDIMIIHYSML